MVKKNPLAAYLIDQVSDKFPDSEALARIGQGKLIQEDFKTIGKFQRNSEVRAFWIDMHIIRGFADKAQDPNGPDIIYKTALQNIPKALDKIAAADPAIFRDLMYVADDFMKSSPSLQKKFSDFAKAWDDVSSHMNAHHISSKLLRQSVMKPESDSDSHEISM